MCFGERTVLIKASGSSEVDTFILQLAGNLTENDADCAHVDENVLS